MRMDLEGKLFVCGTPIGNIKDITYRAVEVLKEVDIIAAEDTRKTGKLLQEYNIATELISYHQHNEKERAQQLLGFLQEGRSLALVSNAGMPGISDPGSELIKLAINRGFEVVSVPGPTALISALVVSGLPMRRFVFEGFLPRKGQERQECLRRIKKEQRTVLIYESPYRLQKTLQELKPITAGRKMAVVRELTKMYEEKIYGTCSEIMEKISGEEIKGEIVIVLEGRGETEAENGGWEDLGIVEHVELLMERGGYTKKEAIKEVSRLRQLSRKKVYKKAIEIKVDPDKI